MGFLEGILAAFGKIARTSPRTDNMPTSPVDHCTPADRRTPRTRGRAHAQSNPKCASRDNLGKFVIELDTSPRAADRREFSPVRARRVLQRHDLPPRDLGFVAQGGGYDEKYARKPTSPAFRTSPATAFRIAAAPSARARLATRTAATRSSISTSRTTRGSIRSRAAGATRCSGASSRHGRGRRHRRSRYRRVGRSKRMRRSSRDHHRIGNEVSASRLPRT
jgi:hypothetical protein